MGVLSHSTTTPSVTWVVGVLSHSTSTPGVTWVMGVSSHSTTPISYILANFYQCICVNRFVHALKYMYIECQNLFNWYVTYNSFNSL